MTLQKWKDTAAGQVLDVLLREGPTTVKDLQDALGLSGTAVRAHLSRLMAEGLIEVRTERHGVGRPVKVYALTSQARSAMGAHTDVFVAALLEEIYQTEGEEKVRRLLQRVSRRLATRYQGEIHGRTLEERVRTLTRLLNKHGIVADMVVKEDRIEIHEYTCPYHELAHHHRTVCEMEREIMSTVLQAPVAMRQCMMEENGGKCVFEVQVTGASS